MLCVTKVACKIAAASADEHSWYAGEITFALKGTKDLVNRQLRNWLRCSDFLQHRPDKLVEFGRISIEQYFQL